MDLLGQAQKKQDDSNSQSLPDLSGLLDPIEPTSDTTQPSLMAQDSSSVSTDTPVSDPLPTGLTDISQTPVDTNPPVIEPTSDTEAPVDPPVIPEPTITPPTSEPVISELPIPPDLPPVVEMPVSQPIVEPTTVDYSQSTPPANEPPITPPSEPAPLDAVPVNPLLATTPHDGQTTTSVPPTTTPPVKAKSNLKKGLLFAVIALFLLTLPVIGFFVSQRDEQIADTRSAAAECDWCTGRDQCAQAGAGWNWGGSESYCAGANNENQGNACCRQGGGGANPTSPPGGGSNVCATVGSARGCEGKNFGWQGDFEGTCIRCFDNDPSGNRCGRDFCNTTTMCSPSDCYDVTTNYPTCNSRSLNAGSGGCSTGKICCGEPISGTSPPATTIPPSDCKSVGTRVNASSECCSREVEDTLFPTAPRLVCATQGTGYIGDDTTSARNMCAPSGTTAPTCFNQGVGSNCVGFNGTCNATGEVTINRIIYSTCSCVPNNNNPTAPPGATATLAANGCFVDNPSVTSPSINIQNCPGSYTLKTFVRDAAPGTSNGDCVGTNATNGTALPDQTVGNGNISLPTTPCGKCYQIDISVPDANNAGTKQFGTAGYTGDCPAQPTTPPVAGQCQNIKIYREDVLLTSNLYNTIKTGQKITVALVGPATATKAHFSFQYPTAPGTAVPTVMTYIETTSKNPAGEFILEHTVPTILAAGQVSITGELFIDNTWR